MKISIKKINGEVIFSGDFDSIRACVEHAIAEGKNLRDADLRYADLSDANLRDADLRYADLRYADLRYADLSDADLSDANLRYADLSSIKSDFLAEVLRLPNELEFLRDAIIGGKINGTSYNDGQCGCLAGTLAIAKGIRDYNGGPITNGLTFHADGSSPRERFFLAIKKGDTPENNAASKIALEWTEEAIAIRDNIRVTASTVQKIPPPSFARFAKPNSCHRG